MLLVTFDVIYRERMEKAGAAPWRFHSHLLERVPLSQPMSCPTKNQTTNVYYQHQHPKNNNNNNNNNNNMAAILCSSIGSCCSSIGHCLTFPCTACSSCCSSLCSTLGRALTSPFTPYLLTTVLLNLPPVLWGLRTLVEVLKFGVKCQNSRWLYVNALLSLVHLLAAFYIVHRIQQERRAENESIEATVVVEGKTVETAVDPEGAGQNHADSTPYKAMDADKINNNNNNNTTFDWQSVASYVFPGPTMATRAVQSVWESGEGEANSWQRLKQVLCYDTGVALYIVATLLWLVWQSVGISQVLFGKEDSDDYRCENIEKRTVLSILCGFLYIMLVFVTFACSFACLK